MSSQIDDLAAEVSKEKKLRSRSEHYSKQLEDEIEILKVEFRLLDFVFWCIGMSA